MTTEYVIGRHTSRNHPHCPECNHESTHGYTDKELTEKTHLTYCSECLTEYTVGLNPIPEGNLHNGIYLSVLPTGNKKEHRYLLMELEPQEKPLYIVTRRVQYEHEKETLGELSGNVYHYNVGTCPVNWLRDEIVDVVYDGEADPHGIFRLAGLVSRNDMPTQ